MAKKENKEIKKAVKDYEILTGDAEIKRLAEIRLMSELEEHSALATARAKGTEEGLKLRKRRRKKVTESKKERNFGVEEEKIKIVKKLKAKNMPIEEIAEITGLTEEEINNIIP